MKTTIDFMFNGLPVCYLYGNTADLYDDNLILSDYLIKKCAEKGVDVIGYLDAGGSYAELPENFRQIDESIVNKQAVDDALSVADQVRKALIIRLEGVTSQQARQAFISNLSEMRFHKFSNNILILVGDENDVEIIKNNALFNIVQLEKPSTEEITAYVRKRLAHVMADDQIKAFIRMCNGRFLRQIKAFVDDIIRTKKVSAILSAMENDGGAPYCAPVRMSDVIGLEGVKQQLLRMVVLPRKSPADFKELGIKTLGGLLLYGLPGCGKSFLVQALATEIQAVLYYIKISDIMSMWAGQSEENIHNTFVLAARQKLSIVFIDEVDALTPKRDGATDYMQRLMAQLLIEMQNAPANIIILAASNRPWLIDSAFLRSQRLSYKVYIPLPNEEDRRKHLAHLIGKKGRNIDLAALATKTSKFNNADVSVLYNEAAMHSIEKKHERGELILTMQDFEDALITVHSTVSPEDERELIFNMKKYFNINLTTL